MPLTRLMLPIRAHNALWRQGYKTVGAVIALSRGELLAIPQRWKAAPTTSWPPSNACAKNSPTVDISAGLIYEVRTGLAGPVCTRCNP